MINCMDLVIKKNFELSNGNLSKQLEISYIIIYKVEHTQM